MMRTWSVCFLLALAVLFLHRDVDAAVEEACKVAAGRSPIVKYEFCVAALRADPASGSADDKGLAIIATKLSAANATSTKAVINGLLKQKPGERNVKECLETCLELYDEAILTLKEAVGELRSGRYDDARMQLSSALGAPVTCEETFEVAGVPSSLSGEDANAEQLSTIALAIASMLK